MCISEILAQVLAHMRASDTYTCARDSHQILKRYRACLYRQPVVLLHRDELLTCVCVYTHVSKHKKKKSVIAGILPMDAALVDSGPAVR